MTAMTSFHAEKCCHLVSVTQRLSSTYSAASPVPVLEDGPLGLALLCLRLQLSHKALVLQLLLIPSNACFILSHAGTATVASLATGCGVCLRVQTQHSTPSVFTVPV